MGIVSSTNWRDLEAGSRRGSCFTDADVKGQEIKWQRRLWAGPGTRPADRTASSDSSQFRDHMPLLRGSPYKALQCPPAPRRLSAQSLRLSTPLSSPQPEDSRVS